jgi:kanamycin kinase
MMVPVSDSLRRAYSRYTWVPVTIGASGATVFCLEDKAARPQLYVKIQSVPAAWNVPSTLEESARLTWLAGQGIPVPDVVESDADGRSEWLVTRAVSGRVAAEDWEADRRNSVVDVVSDFVGALHALKPEDCPFDRTLKITVPQAEAAVLDGRIDFRSGGRQESAHEGWGAGKLLEELHLTMPDVEDVVVCHGDYCLPNLVLDPETLDVTGLIDVGRLGRADRFADLGLMARSIGSEQWNPQFGPDHAARFLRRAGASTDDQRVGFYRLLDEFF